MSYNYLTQYNSPNYTPASEARSVWGRPRTIEAIAIHHWGDPNTNPTFEGVINVLCNPSRQASAHFVATGTGRRVACLVNIPDASWATNSANPYTISIECDPRCRDEDYDVVAELIAELRREYGNLPLLPHKQFSATACPGNYDLARLDREARVKIPGFDFGTSTNPPKPLPTPTPTPTIKYDQMATTTYRVKKATQLYDFAAGKNVKAYAVGELIEIVAKATALTGKVYLMTAYSFNSGNIKATNGFLEADMEVYVPVNPTPVPIPNPEPTVPDRIGVAEQRLTALEALVKKITDFLSSIFKNF